MPLIGGYVELIVMARASAAARIVQTDDDAPDLAQAIVNSSNDGYKMKMSLAFGLVE